MWFLKISLLKLRTFSSSLIFLLSLSNNKQRGRRSLFFRRQVKQSPRCMRRRHRFHDMRPPLRPLFKILSGVYFQWLKAAWQKSVASVGRPLRTAAVDGVEGGTGSHRVSTPEKISRSPACRVGKQLVDEHRCLLHFMVFTFRRAARQKFKRTRHYYF